METIRTVKKVIGELTKCYALSKLTYKGESCLLVAAEKKDPCLLFDKNYKQIMKVWSEPGGTMSIVPIPEKDGEFLAVQQFYSPNDSCNAKIVYVSLKDGSSIIKKLVDLPFVHRFDIVEREDKKYLIACTIKSQHDFKDDWNHPGAIYVAELPEDLDSACGKAIFHMSAIKTGLSHNHGYTRNVENGITQSIISSDQGVFVVTPPGYKESNWAIQQILDEATSDAILIDLNGDGEKELIAITPFHGDNVKVFEKKDNQYTLAFECPFKVEFAHAIAAGTIQGQNTVVIGHRKGNRNLFLIQYDKTINNYKTVLVDADVGPANVLLLNGKDKDTIISANRETDEIAVYEIDKKE